MSSLVSLLTLILSFHVWATSASQYHHAQCPAPKNQSAITPLGKCPDDFTIIGPQIEPIHEGKTAPVGLAVDPNLDVYFIYPRNFAESLNNVVIATNYTDEEPWPSAEIQNCTTGQDPSTCFINVQNLVLDSHNVLWAVDNGIATGQTAPVPGGAKIMSFDIASRKLIKTYPIPTPMLVNNTNLNDVRINNTLGTAGYAFMTDVSEDAPSLVTMNLADGSVIKRLVNESSTRVDDGYAGSFNGEVIYTWNGTHKQSTKVGADGIALQSGRVYWAVLGSRRWYYIEQSILTNFSLSDAEVSKAVVYPGQIATESAGLTADDRGRVYIPAAEQNAIYYVETWQSQVTEKINDTPPGGTGLVKPKDYVVKTLARNAQIQHIDTAAIYAGWMYFTTNQIELGPHFQYNNTDRRRGPFRSFRIWIGRGPAV